MINTLKSAGAAYWRASEDRLKLCDPSIIIVMIQLNAMKMFLYLQPLIPPKRFDIFPPWLGSEGLGAF